MPQENITKVELERGTMKDAAKDTLDTEDNTLVRVRGGTTWFSWVTLAALLGATVALLVTVHRLNTQLAKERQLHQDRLHHLEAEAEAARVEAERATSERLEGLTKQTMLEKQLKRAQEAVIRSEENLAKQARTSNEYQIRGSTLEQEVVQARAELEAVNAATKEFSGQVEQLQKLVSSQRALQAKSEADYEKLSERYESLKEKTTKSETRMRAMEEEGARKEALLQEAQQQLHSKEDHNLELQEALQRAEREAAETRGFLKNSQERLDDATAQISQHESRVKDLEAQVEVLSHEGAQKETQLKDATQAETQLSQLQQEMTQKEQLLQRVHQEAMQKEEQLKQHQAEARQRQEQLQQAQQEAREKAEQLLHAQQDSQQREQHLQQAQQEAEQKTEQLEQALQEAAHKEEQVQRAYGEIGTLRDTLSQRDATVLEMQAKWQEAEERAAKLEELLKEDQDAETEEESER
nr:trichohyalin-like isoform X1 [Procambarus clarkii]